MRTREERTTFSRHFTWIEAFASGWWGGQRNATVILEIKHEPLRDDAPYVLTSRLPGDSFHSQGYTSVEEAQEAADSLWEGWAHAMGLSIVPDAT